MKNLEKIGRRILEVLVGEKDREIASGRLQLREMELMVERLKFDLDSARNETEMARECLRDRASEDSNHIRELINCASDVQRMADHAANFFAAWNRTAESIGAPKVRIDVR